MASLNDVLLALGRVQEGVDRLREDFQEEKQLARDSRAAIHRRLDEHADDLSDLRKDVAISAHVDAQVRNELKALTETVESNQAQVEPSVKEWQRMKALGIGLTGLLALGGLSIGAVLIWMSETAANAVRHWLKL